MRESTPDPKSTTSWDAIISDIRISESAHGPAGQRRYSYEPTFLLRGLTELNIEFTAGG